MIYSLEYSKVRVTMRANPTHLGLTRTWPAQCKKTHPDEGVTTFLEDHSRRITRSMSRGESSIPSSLSLFCITLV